jgi:hypothetical protein
MGGPTSKTRELRKRRQRAIRASDLARLVVCEQKAAFEDRYGERQDARSARNIDEGNRQHAAFLRQAFLVNPALKSSEAKPWCFVSTFLTVVRFLFKRITVYFRNHSNDEDRIKKSLRR